MTRHDTCHDTREWHQVKIWDAKDGALLRVYRGLSHSELTSACLDFRERKVRRHFAVPMLIDAGRDHGEC